MTGTARLSEIRAGDSVYIERVVGKGAFRRRIGEMGFVKGKKVTVIKNAPLNDPVEFSIMGYNVSLRRTEAAMILVSSREQQLTGVPSFRRETIWTEEHQPVSGSSRVIKVALVGNPNSGKTTLFNYATRSHEHVGNYTGVTVSSKTAVFYLGDTMFHITDLPGTYSISAYSPEELFVRDFILRENPDVVVNIVDAANLERNLFLTTQLIDMQVKVVVALNMFDELVSNHDRFDYNELGRMLGIPFVPTIGSRGRGIKRLFAKIIAVHTGTEPSLRSIRINYGYEVETSVSRIVALLSRVDDLAGNGNIAPRFIALRLLGKDRHAEDCVIHSPHFKEIVKISREESERIENLLGEPAETIITDARYGFISGALHETFKPGIIDRRRITNSIDHLLTNRILGIPVFLLFMWVMFSATFNLGAYPQDWIERGVNLLSELLNNSMTDGLLKQLLTEGIIGGVGGVIVFLPNILILFFFISLMEDTGYMARAAFITDKLMHKIGLHGQSFIPLVMGFGCNVPAIMATRTIENRRNRLLTILINPFMSCTARLPVYILLIGTIFPGYKGTMLFGIYMAGILMAIVVALILKSTMLKSDDAPFVMELPPYRLPTIRSILKHMWMRASEYVKKMGGIIMIASILIWALGHFPVQKPVAGVTQPVAATSRDSYIERIGKFIEPAIEPLGFDWRMGVCLLTGVAAKEIVVSTMGVIYQDKTLDSSSVSLEYRIQQATYAEGKRMGKSVFTPLATLSFLLFTLIYFPCIATLTAVYNETGNWKWTVFSAFFTTGLAWIVSFVVYQTGMLFI